MPSIERIQGNIDLIKQFIKELEDSLDDSGLPESACTRIRYNLIDCAWSMMRVESTLNTVKQAKPCDYDYLP